MEMLTLEIEARIVARIIGDSNYYITDFELVHQRMGRTTTWSRVGLAVSPRDICGPSSGNALARQQVGGAKA